MSISYLPADVLGYIFKDLDAYHILKCMRVSKEWSIFLKEDAIWKYFADQGTFKAFQENLINKEKALRKRCSKQFLEGFSIIFGKYAFLHQFPIIEVLKKEMNRTHRADRRYYFPDYKFYKSSKPIPIAIGIVKDHLFTTEPSYLLCSFIDIKSKTSYPISLSFNNSKEGLVVNLFSNLLKKKDDFVKLSGIGVLNTQLQLRRYRDIIEGKYHRFKLNET